MDEAGQSRARAWQPLTPRGVAAFADASWGRLLLVQFATALLAAVVVLWFLKTAWFPVIETAIRQLPQTGAIRGGRLEWPVRSPVSLAQGRFLGIIVDLNHEGAARSPAQVQVEFGRSDVRVMSLFGYVERRYAKTWTIGFNRGEMEPWWGAWSPMLLGLSALSVLAGLMGCWALLSILYTPCVWVAGFFANRALSWGGSWRLAGAAVLPGALLMTAAVALYGLGGLDLIRLTLAAALHLVAGWVYLGLGVWRAPRLVKAATGRENPFARSTGG